MIRTLLTLAAGIGVGVAVPAAWSVTTIAFIRHLPLCLLSRSSTTSYLVQSYLSTSSLRSRHHHSNNHCKSDGAASRCGPSACRASLHCWLSRS